MIHFHEFETSALSIMAPFFCRVQQHRPFVLHKTAMTLDGRTAVPGGDSRWITSALSRHVVHRLRAISDAVIVGKGTFLYDNPALDCRLDEFNAHPLPAKVEWLGCTDYVLQSILEQNFGHKAHSPLRVVFGLPSRLDRKARFFADDNYLFIADEREHTEVAAVLQREGTLLRVESLNGEGGAARALECLRQRGVNQVLLEGGATLAGAFHDAGLVDRMLAFIAPKVVGAGIPVINGRNLDTMADAAQWQTAGCCLLGGDVLYCADKRR
jgi:diaminohydroxyphosphoribosylaminopyrimidine deaminase/5-amino-6-(5-phosphoribosylamino)uracil reductase